MNQLLQKLLCTTLMLVVFVTPAQAEKQLATWSGMNHWTSTPLNLDGALSPEPEVCVKPYQEPYINACKGVDLDNLIQDILDSKSNTYYYTLYKEGKFWAKFPEFLDRLYAKDSSIKVYAMFLPDAWVDLDMVERTQQIAELAINHPNLVGVNIDDYDNSHYQDADVYTVAQLQAMRDKLNGEFSGGRRLELLITAYYKPTSDPKALLTKPSELAKYEINNGSEYIFDGVVFAVVWGSNGVFGDGLKYVEHLPGQINTLRHNLLPGTKIYTLLYANNYSQGFSTEVQYLRDATEIALDQTEGLVMYRLHTKYMTTWDGQNHLHEEKKVMIPELFRAYEAQQLASVKSCGWWDCSSELAFNGQKFNFSTSWAMMVVDPKTKNVVSSTAYNVLNVATESARMVADMDNIPYGHMVIVGTQDEPSANSDDVMTALCVNFGACTYQNTNFGWRSMYYMIGYKGQLSPISENYQSYSHGSVSSISSNPASMGFVAPTGNIASVKSCGWWDCVGRLTFGEHTLSTGSSWNMMVVDPVTKKVTSQGSYNVHNDANEATRLVNDLANIPWGHLLIVGTQDEPYVNSSSVTQNLCNYFGACSYSMGFRGMYYMIGKKGESPIAEGFKRYDYNAVPNSLFSGFNKINF